MQARRIFLATPTALAQNLSAKQCRSMAASQAFTTKAPMATTPRLATTGPVRPSPATAPIPNGRRVEKSGRLARCVALGSLISLT